MTQKHMASASIHDDEIDLFELAQNIWREKILVAMLTLILTALATGYALLSPPIYEAKTALVSPSNADIEEYNKAQKFLLQTTSEKISYQLFTQEKIFERFTTNLNSRQLRNIFFKKHHVPHLTKENQILIKQPNKKTTDNAYLLTVQLANPELAAQWANEFVELAIEETKADLRKDIQAAIQLEKDSVAKKIEILREAAKRKRLAEIARLQEALWIAESIEQEAHLLPAGKAMQEAADYIDRNLIYLRGTKALRAQIKILQERKTDDPFIEDISDLEVYLDQLKAVIINDETSQVVKIDEKAKVPEIPIKPKRKLIVAIGFVSGGMLGIFVALLRSIIRKRKEEAIQNA